MATIDKRGRFWHARIRRHEYPSCSRTIDTYLEAQAWTRETEASMDRNSYVDQSATRRTLPGDLFTRYREEVAPRHKGGDVEAYRLRAWEREHPLRKFAVANVTTADLQGGISYRETEVAADTVLYEINLLHCTTRAATRRVGVPE